MHINCFSCQDDLVALTEFGFEDFYTFYRNLTGRQEVEKIFEELWVRPSNIVIRETRRNCSSFGCVQANKLWCHFMVSFDLVHYLPPSVLSGAAAKRSASRSSNLWNSWIATSATRGLMRSSIRMPILIEPGTSFISTSLPKPIPKKVCPYLFEAPKIGVFIASLPVEKV